MREAKVRAGMILEEAHSSAAAAAAAAAVSGDREIVPTAERQELQAEIAYLRTFSDVCRTHLRAYMESLTRSIEEWERAEHNGALAARDSVSGSARHSPSTGTSDRQGQASPSASAAALAQTRDAP